jgi:CRP-like cAMP-binding protein
MADSSAGDGRPGNRLLAALPADELDRLRPHLERRRYDVKELVHRPGEPIEAVVFPTTGVFSLVTSMADGTTMEVATVGDEGMVGVPVFLGDVSSPLTVYSQIPGEALCLPAAKLRSFVRDGSRLHDLLLRYVQALFILTAQSVACNRLHSVQQRCARWLLMCHDRTHTDEFPLTQEFMAQMLGIRRASVTEAAGQLQGAGLIRYQRGVITILDRPGLERASCECYGIIRAEFDRLPE